jgi:hypothetical protein
MRLFLLLNGIGWGVAAGLFLGVRRRHRLSCAAGLVYAAFMALQGLGHGVAWLVSGRYFGGFAGAVTGLALLAIGVPLARALLRELEELGSERDPLAPE